MAVAVFMNQGRDFINSIIESNAEAVPWRIGLSKNAVTGVTDVLTTYTGNEATFPGYARQNIVGISSGPAIDANGNSQMLQTGFTFTCTGAPGAPETILSWFLYESGGSQLIAACNLDVPVTITNPGDAVTFALNQYAGDITPPL